MNKTDQQQNTRSARSFFGLETCLRLERNPTGTWMMVGRKNGTGWAWQKAKLNPAELGDILCVLAGKTDKVSFFHTFTKDGVKKETRITVNKAEDTPNIFFRIEEHAKPLNLGEQEVLRALLQRVLDEGCEDNWQPETIAESTA